MNIAWYRPELNRSVVLVLEIVIHNLTNKNKVRIQTPNTRWDDSNPNYTTNDNEKLTAAGGQVCSSLFTSLAVTYKTWGSLIDEIYSGKIYLSHLTHTWAQLEKHATWTLGKSPSGKGRPSTVNMKPGLPQIHIMPQRMKCGNQPDESNLPSTMKRIPELWPQPFGRSTGTTGIQKTDTICQYHTDYAMLLRNPIW